MADEKQRGSGTPEDEFGDFISDSAHPPKGSGSGGLGGADQGGLGNLPPLSDFESESSTRGGRFDSGLPPLGEIQPEDPRPTGGSIRPAPPGFEEKSAFDTPISDSGLTTPTSRTGFQDLTTDSDFSPETPEIGPGPDSDLETPMFDSAFGPGGGFDRTPDTSAPTQAMETPMFGERSRSSAFDMDAFGPSSGGGAAGGTPIPDFSPDTGIPGRVAPPLQPMDRPPVIEKSGMGAGAAVGLALVALIIGAALSMFFGEKIPGNPMAQKLSEAQSQVETLNGQVTSLNKRINDILSGGGTLPEGTPPPNIDEMLKQAESLKSEIAASNSELQKLQADLAALQTNVDKATQEYSDVKAAHDELVNDTAVVRLQSEGLAADVKRLQSQVGSLEEAAARAASLKQGLTSDVNKLEILVREGINLTPAKYAHADRLAAVQQLKADLAASTVVTPELLKRYTDLYQKELEIAAAREYFFAKIPVKDRYGVVYQKWAEAVMNGNWSVYFRTLDGQNIGVYERVAGSNPARYEFRQFLPAEIERQVEKEVISARTPGYEERINALAQREVTMQDKSGIQRVFDSL